MAVPVHAQRDTLFIRIDPVEKFPYRVTVLYAKDCVRQRLV